MSAPLTLAQGAQALGLALSPTQLQQLSSYVDLIQKWNQVYNLTALRDPADMLTHHLFDSLAVVQPLCQQLATLAPGQQPRRLLDVGSGAGLPGVVLAICCPDVQVSCVDTVGKKAAFVRQVALALRLPNLQGVHARVEALTQTFDVVCSRAFASLQDFTQWSAQALAEGGVWLAMKGKYPQDELAALTAAHVFHVEPVQVPGLDAERCLLWLKPGAAPKPADGAAHPAAPPAP